MRQAFSIIELMIVVAIIGILAAIAVPEFLEMQARAKRAEVPGIVDTLKTSQIAYQASFDTFLPLVESPPGTPGKSPRDWVDAGGFSSLGWYPDGKVRGVYSASLNGAEDFVVSGTCDIDDDGIRAEYTATKTIGTTQLTANDVY